MVFDLDVILNNYIDPETGMAHVWESTGSIQKKPFINHEYVVPEKISCLFTAAGTTILFLY